MGPSPDERAQPLLGCVGVSVDLASAVGATRVLEDIDLTCAPGEFISVLGASGTGKTTLLRSIAGLVRPAAGIITYQGGAVSPGIGGVTIVFQDYSSALLPWRSVGRNVGLGLEGRVSRKEAADRVVTALRTVGLEHTLHEHPWRLSGGMQQRVQIARALAMRPSLLLMDEPFGSLDAMTKADLQDMLQKVARETGTAVIFITHDIDEAIYLGDRVVVLHGRPARLVADAPVRLPRPRDQVSTRELDDYLQLRREVIRVLTSGGDLT